MLLRQGAPASTPDQIFLLSAYIYEDVVNTAYMGDVSLIADSFTGLGIEVWGWPMESRTLPRSMSLIPRDWRVMFTTLGGVRSERPQPAESAGVRNIPSTMSVIHIPCMLGSIPGCQFAATAHATVTCFSGVSHHAM